MDIYEIKGFFDNGFRSAEKVIRNQNRIHEILPYMHRNITTQHNPQLRF
uniref:Uncharacterized protein n=1 Tax=Klebsiella pneumoniae TaxID=573 RepID=A0A8B0STR8_KLEPN|nr:hypothetical protein [Klebsiella pneumoniae]